jgi:hypothetical protein
VAFGLIGWKITSQQASASPKNGEADGEKCESILLRENRRLRSGRVAERVGCNGPPPSATRQPLLPQDRTGVASPATAVEVKP